MGTMIQNYWTTFFGVLAAISNQAAGPGFKIPTIFTEVLQTILSFAIVGFGVVSKDATTGSKPSQ